MEKKFYLPEFGYEVTLGKFAAQADGAVWFSQGGTVVLSTVVCAPSSEFPGFFPLTVDYREQFAAAGKIPGGYLKREGKSSDKEVLVGRLIDRSIRPLFPANYFDQVQLISTVYSVDKENVPYSLALLASSLALAISKIPFISPIGAVEMVKLEDKWIACPSFSQTQQSKSKITVAGTQEGICMVEGCVDEISEAELIDVLFLAHETIKKQVAWQKEIADQVGVQKEVIVDKFDWELWTDRAKKIISKEGVEVICSPLKEVRKAETKRIKELFLQVYKTEIEELAISNTYIEYVFDLALKQELSDRVFKIGKRIDGRGFDVVRKIYTEVGLLPYNHGSALFQRGNTQALVSVTLGGGQDEQRVDDVMGEGSERSFMLHYNFPPFSVGEVKPLRGPSRRDVGHGYLAASAISQVLPSKEAFPYTIRVVSDILESDGSSSMATVCGSTMSLMQAGVPIRKMVSGVAMGLIMDETYQKFQVLTDISGIEDAFGMMDFKVAGTQEGITAIQMDIKYKGGLSRSVFEQSLAQALAGRIHILNEMKKVMTEPNKSLSSTVPQVHSFKILPDKIGAVIGKAGSMIRTIIEKTGTSIDIEEDGTVKIYGQPSAETDLAIKWVKLLGGKIEVGVRYTGKIRKIAEFGIFVELVPGVDGLVHISCMPKKLQSTFTKEMKIDSNVQVEILDYDKSTDRIRLKLLE